MFDLLIKNALVQGIGKNIDIAIVGSKIIEIAPNIPDQSAINIINAGGNLVVPGFVDSHMHLDKAFTLGETEAKTLEVAGINFSAFINSIPAGELKQNIKDRARKVALMAVQAGTTTIRTNVNIEIGTNILGLEALSELREELKDCIDIQITALMNFFDSHEVQLERIALIESLCNQGLFDYIGAAPHLHENWEELTNIIFKVASVKKVPLDLHVDESDFPNISNFLQIANLTQKYGLEGRVSCGHVTALNSVEDVLATRAISLAKKVDLSIITLPSCNLYLMGRTDKQPIRRGVTRIREFLEAGINIAYASDNVRDPYRPIGNADMLEEGLLTAQIAQMVTRSELENIFDMGTKNAAKACLLQDYGLQKDKTADIVILETNSKADAIISQATRLFVIKNGKIVAKTVKNVELFHGNYK
ncbi:MAG: amidohydrolase family protein [Clostridia bacterium]